MYTKKLVILSLVCYLKPWVLYIYGVFVRTALSRVLLDCMWSWPETWIVWVKQYQWIVGSDLLIFSQILNDTYEYVTSISKQCLCCLLCFLVCFSTQYFMLFHKRFVWPVILCYRRLYTFVFELLNSLKLQLTWFLSILGHQECSWMLTATCVSNPPNNRIHFRESKMQFYFTHHSLLFCLSALCNSNFWLIC